MTNTHSSYGLGRNFITYITSTTLLHLGAVIFVKLHVTRLLNESVGLVENTVSMRVCSITNKYALISSSLKFRQTNTFPWRGYGVLRVHRPPRAQQGRIS